MHSFEKLEVWQKSRSFAQAVYGGTSNFPEQERYGLTSQLRRSAISVSSNIAEGSSRLSGKDKSRFYEIAYGSLIEALNQVILANDLGFLSESDLNSLRKDIDEISRMLSGLYKSART